MRYCDYCGKEIPLHAKVCPYCKKMLVDDDIKITFSGASNTSDPTRKLDISKYINPENRYDDEDTKYFDKPLGNTREEIENHFSQQPVERAYTSVQNDVDNSDENDYIQNQQVTEREYRRKPTKKATSKKAKTKNRNKKNKKSLVVLILIIAIIVVVAFAIIINPFASKDTSLQDLNNESTTTTTAVTTTETTTAETTTETTTTQPTTISANSTDLDGYLGVSYSSIASDFGSEIKDSTYDDYYGGNTYYYDGLTVSTNGSGSILSVKVDYTTASDKDLYRYQEITYYSMYDDVLADMGEPQLDQLNDATESCVGYTTESSTSQFIKIMFDDNKKVSGFEMYYSD